MTARIFDGGRDTDFGKMRRVFRASVRKNEAGFLPLCTVKCGGFSAPYKENSDGFYGVAPPDVGGKNSAIS